MFYVLLLHLFFKFCLFVRSFFGCFFNRFLSFLSFFFHLFCDNLPCSGMFRNVPGFVDALVTYVSQKVPREIRNRWRLLVSVGLKLQGIFFNFQENFLCIYSTLVFKKYSSS